MDFRCPLTEVEQDRWHRITRHYRDKEGIRSGTAVFRSWMLEAEKRIKQAEAKEAAK